MNWFEETTVPAYSLVLAAFAWLAAEMLWAVRAARRDQRPTRPGRITMRVGGVIHAHPTECADCGDARRYTDGSCWTCAGRRRQPRAIHRETAA